MTDNLKLPTETKSLAGLNFCGNFASVATIAPVTIFGQWIASNTSSSFAPERPTCSSSCSTRIASSMAENPETPSEVSPDDAKFWLAEIDAAKARLKSWYEQADDVQERYDACPDDEKLEFGAINLIWANVDTQISAIGEDFGKPQVSRVNQPD